jgi:hypothetical protein
VKFTKFRIQNFKGIAGASVFAFVGLNESGKTTVLEAIHSFSPDDATGELLGGDREIGVPYHERVPRHQLSSFTGDVSVAATVIVDEDEKKQIAAEVLEALKLVVDVSAFPSEIVFDRRQHFKDGDFQSTEFVLCTPLTVKAPSQRKLRKTTPEELQLIGALAYQYTPDIAYFPTFVFDFPERIYLTQRGDELDRFYRRVFQDILDYDGKDYKIEKDIIRRVRTQDMLIPWLSFLTAWSDRADADKIQHVMDRASATVTKAVFGRWNKIFGEDTRGKEIVITFDITEGEKKDQKGLLIKTNAHDVYIKFKIRDGTRRFDVNDRSLGFRWFFAFMLFRQFRVARADSRPMLFLFDEPASNLHAAAQQKLIDSFPEIAKGPHALAYTTHSHYMIEPKWLEQTFIVTNRADAPPASILDAVSLDDESLDIKVSSYRSFVNDHPSQTSYFQPILDRLEVVPSRFDIQKASIVLEGRSDYYILRYAARLLARSDLPFIPGLGAGTFGALAAMHVGWNLNFLFLLDGDGQGKAEQKRYMKEYGIPRDRMATIDEFVSGVSEMEDLLDTTARNTLKKELNLTGELTKPQIKRFFQERLASDNIVDLGPHFSSAAKSLLDAMEERLG